MFFFTKIFAEHMQRQSVVETSASIISDAAAEVPLATVSPLALQLPSSADSGVSAVQQQQSGVISPLTPETTATNAANAVRRSITEDMVAGLHSSPRNSLIMRRRSVDMSYMMTAKAAQSHDPQDNAFASVEQDDANLLPDSTVFSSTSADEVLAKSSNDDLPEGNASRFNSDAVETNCAVALDSVEEIDPALIEE